MGIEKSGRMKKGWVALIGIAALVIVIFVWFILPVREANISRLFPNTTAGIIVVNIDTENPVVGNLLEQAEDIIQNSGFSSFKKKLFTALFPGIVPRKIVALYIPNLESVRPQYVVFISLGRLSKVLHIVSSPIDNMLFKGQEIVKKRVRLRKITYIEKAEGDIMPTAKMVFGNNLVISNNPEIISSMVQNKNREENPWWRGTFPVVENVTTADINIILSNTDGGFSSVVKKIETDFAFAAFPSIDAVETMEGNIVLEEDKLEGLMEFKCNDPAQINAVRSDVRFLYGAMRRVVKSFDINMKGEVSEGEESVGLDFYMENYINALLQTMNTFGGE